MNDRHVAAVVSVVAAMLVVAAVATAQPRDPIAGAWEETAVKNLSTGAAATLSNPPLHVIYADGHYVQFTAAAGRTKHPAPVDVAKLTKEQLLERYRLQGQYGTYKVSGNKLVRKVVAAAEPNNEGRESTIDFQVQGNELITVTTGADGQKTERRYRRLRPTT